MQINVVNFRVHILCSVEESFLYMSAGYVTLGFSDAAPAGGDADLVELCLNDSL